MQETDDTLFEIYAQVILNNNSKSTDRIYTYGVRDIHKGNIAVGKRVKVMFGGGKKPLDAVVIHLSAECSLNPSKVKPVEDIIDDAPVMRENLIKIALWMRDRYICKYSDVIRLMIPSAIKFEHKVFIKPTGIVYAPADAREEEFLQALGDGMEIDKLKKIYLETDIYAVLKRLEDKGAIETRSREQSRRRGSHEQWVKLADPAKLLEDYGLSRAPKQEAVVQYLILNGEARVEALNKSLSVSSSIINSLVQKGIIESSMKPVSDTADSLSGACQVNLNSEQQRAFDIITGSGKNVFLLHGVTGSGKTEVYMSVIESFVAKGCQSIMLVPEISLTAQIVERFRERFGSRIAVFHSKLSSKDRFIQWSKVNSGEADVIIGARSALFAPVRRLGAIIVDEEHEDSYKSSTSPKYDAVETAIKMATTEGAKVVLGTATPSVRTYSMALKGQIELIELRNRARDAVMPDIQVVNMCSELDKGNNTIISEPLFESIRLSLKRKEQVILFINKRGYSGFVSCKKCGYVARCDRCDVSMTYHIKDNRLRCHYCGSSKSMFTVCPKCGSDKIEQFGAGTQHVEKFIAKLFPEAAIQRMDVDSMAGRDSYQQVYDDFKTGKIDMLIGTQMLAKGFDFPNVTTVGVLSADAILNLPFYNASEKTFQLLTQVSGRAGRGHKPGRVFIQTYEPGNFIIRAASFGDYSSFVREELKLRNEFAFPPYINIINVCIISRDERLASQTAQSRYNELFKQVKERFKGNELILYRPVPHSIYRINEEYRINLFMKASNSIMPALREIIREVYMSRDIANIKVSININTDTV